METLIFLGVCAGIFCSGVALGAVIENKRMAFLNLYDRVEGLENTTQEILDTLKSEDLPMAEEVNSSQHSLYNSTPGVTQELPAI